MDAVRMELETANAQPGSPSLMPLHYALGALKEVIPQDLADKDREAVETQLREVEHYLDCTLPVDSKTESRPTRDRGGQIHRTLREIRGKLQKLPS